MRLLTPTCDRIPYAHVAERERERSILHAHASRTAPELTECEFRLRTVIEGIDKDKILVRFTHVDPSDPQRECSIVIDVSGESYKGAQPHAPVSTLLKCGTVPTTNPFLPNLPIMLDELNETRDIYAFIRQARQAFEQHIAK